MREHDPQISKGSAGSFKVAVYAAIVIVLIVSIAIFLRHLENDSIRDSYQPVKVCPGGILVYRSSQGLFISTEQNSAIWYRRMRPLAVGVNEQDIC